MTTLRNVLRRAGRLSRLWRIARTGHTTIIEVRQRSLVVVFALVLAWNLIRPTWLALSIIVMLGSLLLINFLWVRAMAANVTSERALRYAAVQVGDTLEESIRLHDASRLPVVSAEFIDQSNVPGYTATSVFTVGGQRSDSRAVQATCTQRGVFTLGPWELRMADPFGIFQVRQFYNQRTEVLVYPPLAVLPPHVLLRRNQMGDLHPLRQPLSAETISVTTTRPYLAGDPLRRVHWRTTARHNDLFVKAFDPEASSSVWLIPDLDAAVHIGQGSESSFETMVILLSSLAFHLLNERLAVGLMADPNTTGAVLPQAGAPHFWTILRALTPLQPIPGQSLTHTLTLARSLVSARDSIIVVTPAITLDWIDALKPLIGSQRYSGVEVILLDPASFGAADDAKAFSAWLAEQGVSTSVVRRDEVRPIQGAYGEIRRWEFKTLGTGRVIVRQTPRQAEPLMKKSA